MVRSLTVFCHAGLAASEMEPIAARTPWRAFLVNGRSIYRLDDGSLELRGGHKKEPFDPAKGDARTLQFSALPPADWAQAAADVAHWPRYYQDEIVAALGQWGRYDPDSAGRGRTTVQLCLRTRFGITDPATAKGLTVTVRYIGGVAVFVNGREIGRQHLGEGDLDPAVILAEDYPAKLTPSTAAKPCPGSRVTPSRKPNGSTTTTRASAASRWPCRPTPW